jgi:RNA polymerase-binding transcription factor
MAAKKTTTVTDVTPTAAKTTAATRSASPKSAPAAKKATPAPKKTAPANKTAPATKTAPAKKTTPAKKTAGGKQATQAAKRSTGKSGPAKRTATSAADKKVAKLAVREGESPWTAAEIAELRETLVSDSTRLRDEIRAAENEIGQLLREGGEGAGNDQADVGSNTFERDHEMSMAKNARANLELVEAAVRRIDEGTYGVCESCGNPIGKMRLQAFPRATLCMECKQRQERR